MWGQCGYRPATLVSDKIRTLDSAIQHVGVILCGGNVDIDHLPWYQTRLDSAIQHVGVILCGGNVDIDHLPWYQT